MNWLNIITDKEQMQDVLAPLHLLVTVKWYQLVLFCGYGFVISCENSPLVLSPDS